MGRVGDQLLSILFTFNQTLKTTESSHKLQHHSASVLQSHGSRSLSIKDRCCSRCFYLVAARSRRVRNVLQFKECQGRDLLQISS
jgi:hypothetical protein